MAATPTWVLSSHDDIRPVTRYQAGRDDRVGTARAMAMALVVLALPGAAFLYNGDELGLPDVELPDEALQDPLWERSGHTIHGTGTGTCSLTGKEAADGLRVSFEDGTRGLPLLEGVPTAAPQEGRDDQG